MAYYIFKYDGVLVEWNGLSVYLTQKNASVMDIEIFVFNWIVVILHLKVDINFKEFDGINDETKNNLLPLCYSKFSLILKYVL